MEETMVESEGSPSQQQPDVPEVDKLMAQIRALESEKQKSYEQFGVQRAKMKVLLLQKEEEQTKLVQEVERLRLELESAKAEAELVEHERLKGQEELSSLQKYLQAMVEESEGEVEALREKTERLETELRLLKVGGGGGAEGGGGPPLLGAPAAMFSTLARKVATQLGATDSHHHSENLEDSMRKVNRSFGRGKGSKKPDQAQEGAEMLKSLLMPLEEEIAALKDKLRDTDTQLRRYQALHPNPINSPSTEQVVSSLNGQSREDSNLVSEQSKSSESAGGGACERCAKAEARLAEVEKEAALVGRYRDQLSQESLLRKEMEDKWTEKKEKHKTQVTELQSKVKSGEEALASLKATFKKTCHDIDLKFNELKEERRKTHIQLEEIQFENEKLMGKYNTHSRELQNEKINLPDTVEALQEMWLGQREELINARIGQERSEESVQSLECLYKASETKQNQLIKDLRMAKEVLDKQHKEMEEKCMRLKSMAQAVEALKQEIVSLKSELHSVRADKAKLEENETELKNRLVSFQKGLENGEAVQKDFVNLSQSLQMELENLRAQNNTLRWEYEEDVLECRGCEQPLKSQTKGKSNCRHCGRIFCLGCLSHRVVSGPSSRESRVCTVCHTILNSQSPPYFSTDPPHHHHHK